MEVFSLKPTTLILFLFLLLANADLSPQELDAALFALRASGYTLFPNAIATSDLQFRLLSNQTSSSFTLFAPSDSLLFSLDLLSSARLYTNSLLPHVSPDFLSTSYLLSLARPLYIDTLLPNRQLFVENTLVSRNGTALLSFTVDGVGVRVPDLFLGSNIAVHGLDGILVAKSRGPRVRDDSTGFGEAPKSSYCETCLSPANPPDSFPPMESGAPEMVTFDTPIEKDGGSDYEDHDGTARKETIFRFKHLFNL